MGNPISKFYQSFSGTDTIAFLMMPGCIPICIGSLTTISYSMFRNKKPVINIGRTNINGVTRGSRIFAGTMIFTLINQHWLRELQEQWPEGKDYGNGYLFSIKDLKVDELPLFDIMIVSANEYGSAVTMYIFGVDFTDEAQTISVEDLFTENTFSFIARDISVFKKFNVSDSLNGSGGVPGTYAVIAHEMPTRTFAFDNSEFTDWNKISNQCKEYINTQLKTEEVLQREYENGFIRDLYYSNSIKKLFVGKDVLLVQQALKKRKLYDGELDSIYSSKVADAVRLFQSEIGYPTINGIVDRRIYSALIYDSDSDNKYKLAIGVNKNGTNIYSKPYLSSSVSGILNYGESIFYADIVEVDDDGVKRLFLRTSRGFICTSDVFSYDFKNFTFELPVLKKGIGNNSAYVIMLQEALQNIYNDFVNYKYGTYDDKTVEFVTRFQREYGDKYGIKCANGEVDPDTWIAIEDVSGGNFGDTIERNFTVDITKMSGDYNVSSTNVLNEMKDFKASFHTNGKIITKVSVISHFPNGNSKTVSSTLEAVDNTTISLLDYRNSLDYDIEEGSSPSKIDFFIYPNNGDPYKWTINIVD